MFTRKDPFYVIAIRLQEYIASYIPKSWTVNISNVSRTPFISKKDVEKFLPSFEAGNLKAILENYDDDSIKKWFVIEAIIDFFEKQKHLLSEGQDIVFVHESKYFS
jgi:hypothetical protein